MKTFVFAFIALASAVQSEPVVSKDSISIHTVRRGNMRLRMSLGGLITSIRPTKALVFAPTSGANLLRTGQTVDFEIQSRRIGGNFPMRSGTVTRIESTNSSDRLGLEVEFSGAPAEDMAVGTSIGALLDTGEEARDIVLFERPADARPNTESMVFVIEPGDEFAKRVAVRYGRQSGAQIEIVAGLAPGDRVIVSDMSRWTVYPRVRLR